MHLVQAKMGKMRVQHSSSIICQLESDRTMPHSTHGHYNATSNFVLCVTYHPRSEAEAISPFEVLLSPARRFLVLDQAQVNHGCCQWFKDRDGGRSTSPIIRLPPLFHMQSSALAIGVSFMIRTLLLPHTLRDPVRSGVAFL